MLLSVSSVVDGVWLSRRAIRSRESYLEWGAEGASCEVLVAKPSRTRALSHTITFVHTFTYVPVL